MAAKGAHVIEKLRDETECCICTGTFVDPRMLPCLHTFCLECLESNVASSKRVPRRLMPCPVCRKEFSIPDSGLAELQKNFLIERLIDIVKAPNAGISKSTGTPCEACLEEADPRLKAAVPPAEMYCVDCQQKLCNDCSLHHRKNKMTKLHTINPIAVDDKPKVKCVLRKCEESNCARHRQELLVYCLDCLENFCPRCCPSVHRGHRISSITKITDEYRELVDAKVKEFCDVELHVQIMKQELEDKGDAVLKQMDLMETLVTERSERIRKLVDTHAMLLQKEINSLKQEKLDGIKLEKEQLEKLQANCIGFCEDCSDRKEFPNVESVILTMNLLKLKASELTQLNEACLKLFESSCPKVVFKESLIDDFLGKSNVIGQVEVVEEKGHTRNPTAWKDPEPVLLTSSKNDVLDEYNWNPRLVGTIKTRASKSEKRIVRGIAILKDELFIIHGNSSDLYIYDACSLDEVETLTIDELNDPCDIASCDTNQCLYIFDGDYVDKPYRIFRLDTNGCIQRKWATGKGYGSVSVTYDSNVVVAYRDRTILKEYSTDGRVIRELAVRTEQCVNGFIHAHKLLNDCFLITYKSDHEQYGLCLVDDNGIVLKDVSDTEGPDNSLNEPRFFAVDSAESIFLVDRKNRRILLFSADLDRNVELLTKRKGLHYPFRVLLDESSGRMFVADNWYDIGADEYRNGRVLVYQVKNV